MFSKLLNFAKKAVAPVLGVFSFFFASFAHALDVTAAVTSITTDGTLAITAIGGAIIGLAALSMIIRWAKATFF